MRIVIPGPSIVGISSKNLTKAQWPFCPLELSFHSLADRLCNAKLVIPFTSRETLKIGTDCSIYKVKIHPCYNQLIPKVGGDIDLSQYFILKSYCAQYDELHENEVRAYKDLGQHKDISSNIAQFYGSWKQGDVRSILFEYIEGSKLTNLFNHDRPASEGDMVEFWTNFTRILGPVCRLHNHHDQGHDEVDGGVHQNIKPDNILASRIHTKSRFAYNFKFANLGSAYNLVSNRSEEAVRGRDRLSIQTYGAPECFRDDFGISDPCTVQVAESSQDIWSLGCVFSEALVWSAFGPTGLDEYRQRLKVATGNVTDMKNTSYSGCFHDGVKRSTVVREMHDRARRSLTILHELISIIEDMMNEDSKERPSAAAVRKDVRKALNAAERISTRGLSVHPTHPSPRQNVAASLPGGTDVQPRLPSLPMKTTRHDWLSDRPAPGPREQFGASSKEQRHQNNDLSGGTPPAFAYQSRSPHQSAQVTPRVASLYERTPVENAPVDAMKSVTGSQSAIKALDSNGAALAHMSERDYHTLECQPDPSFPHATVREVLDWIESRKKKSTAGSIPPVRDIYLDSLRGTDQIFVIDNSISMHQYKLDARKTLEALSYIVKRLDSDGIDMYFTVSKQSDVVHGTHREKLLTQFDNTGFDGQSTVDYTLSKILESRGKRGWKVFFRRESAKGKSIYVLTDGKWLGNNNSLCGVPELLERVVRHVNRRADLGIQFIQFGDDEVGTWRLKELDNHLEQHGVPMDIVDTEHHNGNVYKMLLGHLSSDWMIHQQAQSLSRIRN